MERTIRTSKNPIRIWLKELDEQTLEQAQNLARHPCIDHPVALMPDAHVGYGMPIGGIAVTTDVVIPNGVGVDIGCGVSAVKSSAQHIEKKRLQNIVTAISQKIPTGFSHHKKAQPESKMPRWKPPASSFALVIDREYEKGLHQLGTLGGGNHFIELQKGDDGAIWIMVHSGSRNLGYQVASHYNKLAAQYSKVHFKELSPKWQLDVLGLDSEEGRNYMHEMAYCVEFARYSRRSMINDVQAIMVDMLGDIFFEAILDIAHNYASRETHEGEQVIVHRKGATRMEKGDTGIIPGSQGTKSFIVKGLGSAMSYNSCSHGAGRKLGRKQAIKKLNLAEEQNKLDSQGIIHNLNRKKSLDEAPGAYKDIEMVLDNQRDLVEPLVTLQPLAVVKG